MQKFSVACRLSNLDMENSAHEKKLNGIRIDLRVIAVAVRLS